VEAYKAGNKQQAAQLFHQAINENPDDQIAWLWLYQLVDNPNDKRRCLEQVYRSNPSSDYGKRAAAQLKKLQPTSKAPRLQTTLPKKKKSFWVMVVFLLVLMGCGVYLVGASILESLLSPEQQSEASSTPMPQPTSVPLGNLLFPEDDYIGDIQVNDEPVRTPEFFQDLPPSLSRNGREFLSGGEYAGFAFVVEFPSDSVAFNGYLVLLEGMGLSARRTGVAGEQALLSMSDPDEYSISTRPRADLLFYRCNAVAYIRISREPGNSVPDDDIRTYAQTLDQRIQQHICNQ
jgi:hypothetical protein